MYRIKNGIGCKLNEINFYVRTKCALKDLCVCFENNIYVADGLDLSFIYLFVFHKPVFREKKEKNWIRTQPTTCKYVSTWYVRSIYRWDHRFWPQLTYFLRLSCLLFPFSRLLARSFIHFMYIPIAAAILLIFNAFVYRFFFLRYAVFVVQSKRTTNSKEKVNDHLHDRTRLEICVNRRQTKESGL